MFNLFKAERQFHPKGAEARSEVATQFNSTTRDHPNIQEVAELVLASAVDTYSIPKDWLNVEFFEIKRARGLKEKHLHFIMNRWSDQLLRYSAAFQQQFLAKLSQFEPSINHSLHIVSWRFSDSCELPSAMIPDGVTWHVSNHVNRGTKDSN
jgi:hypothetical protein